MTTPLENRTGVNARGVKCGDDIVRSGFEVVL